MKRVLQKEWLSRVALALMLTLGLLLPLLQALELGAQTLWAVLTAIVVTVGLGVLSLSRKTALVGCVALGVLLLLQLVLPGMGLLGGAVEGVKALLLRFSGLEVALPLFARQVALTFAVLLAGLGYAFTRRGVGFLPAAILLVLVLFGLWSLGKPDLFWYALPALVAILLIIAQNAHENMNPFHALPLALIAVALSFLVLPAGRTTLPPLEEAATNLKQSIEDYLFFTDERNVFSLGSYGYYPMSENNSNTLGGPAEPSEYPVMMVKTDQKTLLRAVVKDYYTGRSFRDLTTAKRYLYINPRWGNLRRSVFLEGLPSEAIRKSSQLLDEKAVTVQMQNNAASTLFTPLFLRRLNTQNDMVPYFNDASELFITRDLQLGDRYTVYAPIFEGGADGLGALVAASLKDDAAYAAVFAEYTQLPTHLEQKVYDDVYNIVAGVEAPYDKALAIMRHLQRYYRYTLTPDTPPDNLDFVTYFLYVGKEGYCTYFASAMTVMCRMAGLPARYVEGFLAMPASDGFAYVTGKEAHAWTEVYFEGFGWVPFDPTPTQQDESETPPQPEQPEPTPTPTPPPPDDPEDDPTPTPPPDDQDEPEPSPEPSPDPEDAPEDSPEDKPPFPWWILAVVAAVALLAWRLGSRTPDRVAARQATDKDKCFVYGNAVYSMLLLTRHAPKSGETPIMFAKRLDSIHAYPVPLTPLWRVLALSNYSRMQPGPAQTERGKDTCRRLFKSLPPLAKLRFLFRAGFGKNVYHALETRLVHVEPPKPITFHTSGGKTVKVKPSRDDSPKGGKPPAKRPPAHGGRPARGGKPTPKQQAKRRTAPARQGSKRRGGAARHGKPPRG